MSHFKQLLATLFLFLSCLGLLNAQQPSLSSDEAITVDTKTSELIARGNALLETEDILISADEIRFNRDKQIINAKGNISVNQANFRFISNEISYELESGYFESKGFRFSSPPIIISGEAFQGTQEEITFTDARIYYDEPTSYGLSLHAESVTVRPNEDVKIQNFTPAIGEIELFSFPSYTHRFDEPSYYISAEAGYKSKLGVYTRTSTLFPINDNLRAGTELDLYTDRGVLFGPAFSWKMDNAETTIKSKLNAGYIHDNGDLGEGILNQEIDPDRYFLEYRHRQSINENIHIRSKVSLLSDSEIHRDFRPDYYNDNEQADNFFEAEWFIDDIIISAFTRFDPNSDFPVSERKPEIRLDKISTELFNTGIYHNFSISVAELEDNNYTADSEDEDTTYTKNTDSVNRFDSLYSLQRPIKLHQGITFTPILSARYTHYSKTQEDEDSYDRFMGEIGADLTLSSYGEWDYKNEYWDINGLRHMLKPSIQVRWHPKGDRGNNKIIPIDDDFFHSYRPEMDLTNSRSIDDLYEKTLIRFSLENLIQTKNSKEEIRDLIDFNLYQDLNLSDDYEGNEWEYTYSEIEIKPAPFLDLGLTTRTVTDSLKTDSILFWSRIKSAELWKLELGMEKLHPDGEYSDANKIEEYRTQFYYRLNDSYAAQLFFKYDGHKNELTEERYTLIQQIGRDWELAYKISNKKNDSRDNDLSFSFSVNFQGF